MARPFLHSPTSPFSNDAERDVAIHYVAQNLVKYNAARVAAEWGLPPALGVTIYELAKRRASSYPR